MSQPPPYARTSQPSGLAPPPPLGQPQLRGSSIFAPPLPTAPLAPPAASVTPNLSRPQSRVEPPPLSATLGPMPGTRERPIHGPSKRLIVTCDGTWNNADNSFINGQKKPPSNVSRIGWAIKDTSRDGIPQVVHYQAGVGTTGTSINKLVTGLIGLGLKENVREAYTYLAINWREGDQIFLIGFSRGAFTARSVAGMIGEIGLLTRAGLPSFSEIFDDFAHRWDDKYVSKVPNSPFPEKGPYDHHYVAELERRGLTKLNIPIKAVCCWDTVGSLGIPRPSIFDIGGKSRELNDYQFYDTKLSNCIENAFQALALDERRGPFTPALWEKRDNDRTKLTQVWFPGVHTNVGGGYEDQEISDITLAWMMSRLEPFLDFRPDFVMRTSEENRAYYKTSGQKVRPWSFGEIYNSFKGLTSIAGAKTRTPGNYYRTNPYNGRPTSKLLKGTHEYIHASVRCRIGMRGPGVSDRGVYEPPALKDWTFAAEPADGPGGNVGGSIVIWTKHTDRDGGGQDRIPEATLLETELALLRQSNRAEEYVRTLRDPKQEKRRHRQTNGDVAMMSGANGGRNSRRFDQEDGIPAGGDDPNRRRRERHRDGDRSRTGDPDKDRRRRSRRYDD